MSAEPHSAWNQLVRADLPTTLSIVVVGPCASGKTTLVNELREAGIRARVCGQEHSSVRNLWAKMQPDLLVVLDIDLATLRQRRSPHWPETIYQTQRQRLRGAFDAADLVIDTVVTSPQAAAAQVIAALDERNQRGQRERSSDQ